MVWSFMRVAIFGSAFLCGTLVSTYKDSQFQATADFSVPKLQETAGTALVVACNESRLVVSPLPAHQRSVQLTCLDGKMLVVRDAPEKSEAVMVPVGRNE
jgi:hypothetical protein